MGRFFYRGRFIFFPLAAAAFLSIIGLVVMNLWNYLLPAIIHVSAITFWQAIGIFILCKILFGFGRKGHRMHGGAPWMRRKWEDRFKNMTPEERENFKAQMESRMCGNKWGRGRNRFNTNWDDFAPETEKAAN